jgi:predicted aminopeptidase
MLEPQHPLQRFARPLGFALFAVVFLSIASGCQTSRFYTQAIRGQYDVLSRQVPISKFTNNPSTPPELKQRLQRVQALTEFASVFLKLPAEGYYQKYADLQRPHVVWNVFAADEFSIEAKTWWYPMVGSLKYQGYFRQELAENYATQLRHEGLDVYVGPVSAYSTLGWFRDPILNTWIGYEETHLAELVFHELSHRRLFIHGDTDFNEAFATATARIGVRPVSYTHLTLPTSP